MFETDISFEFVLPSVIDIFVFIWFFFLTKAG